MHRSRDFFIEKNIFEVQFMTSYLYSVCYNIFSWKGAVVKNENLIYRRVFFDKLYR